MKDIKETIEEALALMISRVSIPAATLPIWRSHAEFNATKHMSAQDIYSLCLVEYLSRVVGKSIELGDGRKWADGTRYDKETKTWSVSKVKKGTRQMNALSHTDKEEIRGEIPRVLSFLGAWERKLTPDDWSKCFSRVQSADCLDLNRKWKPCPDGDATLAKLTAPTFDMEKEAARLQALALKAKEAATWIEAAFRADKSRKRKSNRDKWEDMLLDLISGQVISGKGNDFREQKRERAEFLAYLDTGKAALANERLSRSAWQPVESMAQAMQALA